jgi:beta-phosphoglucomutase-like phosphatase (HAD superfamily)
MCVASGSPRSRVDACLEVAKIDACFVPTTDGPDSPSKIFTREDVAKGKPDPEMFLLAASSLGVAPSECVVVEDSTAGIRAALAANMEVVGFLGGGHAQADWYRDNVAAFNIPLVYSQEELYDFLAKR